MVEISKIRAATNYSSDLHAAGSVDGFCGAAAWGVVVRAVAVPGFGTTVSLGTKIEIISFCRVIMARPL